MKDTVVPLSRIWHVFFSMQSTCFRLNFSPWLLYWYFMVSVRLGSRSSVVITGNMLPFGSVISIWFWQKTSSSLLNVEACRLGWSVFIHLLKELESFNREYERERWNIRVHHVRRGVFVSKASVMSFRLSTIQKKFIFARSNDQKRASRLKSVPGVDARKSIN